VRPALLVALTLLAIAAPLPAQQQPPPRPDTTRTARQDTTTLTPQQQALRRLRALGPVAAPDTVTEAPDTARDRPQAVEIRGRGSPVEGGREGTELSAIPRDSVVNTLLALRGYIATEYRGDTAHYRADSTRLELRGSPQVARQGNQLGAKELIVYDQKRAFACGYGEPELRARQMTHPVQSDTVCYYVDRGLAVARGAQTTVDEGASWYVRLDHAYIDARTDNVYSHGGKFTDCDLPWDHKHYYISASEIKVVRHNVMVARNATWYFADVPVFWLPFMVQSLSRGRRSGLLMPRFGINDIARQGRYNRRIEDVGFYLAINDYMGAELALDWMSNNYTSLRGSMDYRFNRQFLNGGLTYRNLWKNEGGRTFTLSTSNSWQPDERTRVGVNANYAQDTRFVQQRTLDPRELNRSIDSNVSISRNFDWAAVSLGGSRRQSLNSGTTTWDPGFSVNFSPVSLFGSAPGEERWYSNASWNGSGSVRLQRTDVGEDNRNLSAQSRREFTSNVSSGFTVGRFSWSQSADFREETRELRAFADTTRAPLPAFDQQTGGWSMSVSYQQPLIGTSTFTPNVSLGGQFIRNDSSDQRLIMAPMRVDFSTSLRTDLYGFWPGIGPFAAFRHRLSPSFSYNYSPRVTADSLQRRAFGGRGVTAERNTLSIGLSQTFEAKYRSEAADTTAAARDTTGGPRRRQQARAVNLLSISTEALLYDFVRARDGLGIVNTQIGNSVQSDLLRGLQLSFAHELFRTDTVISEVSGLSGNVGDGHIRPLAVRNATATRRVFDPHLSTVNASFSLSGNSWLFRVLRLGRRDTVPEARDTPPPEEDEPVQAGPAIDRTQSEFGLVGTSRRSETSSRRSGVGTWSGSFNYTMIRPRNAAAGSTNQMMTGNFSFQPTENWTVRWSTGYSFTTKDFTDHVLTLTRTLHDWDANFDFLKAQNGNFSFQFRVHLRANPDIKLDYSQHDVQTTPR
jgi:hypothetical protein